MRQIVIVRYIFVVIVISDELKLFLFVNQCLFVIAAMQVGPSLGMRKSSSLESLQTAIQETQRNPARHEPIYARANPRKCYIYRNEIMIIKFYGFAMLPKRQILLKSVQELPIFL